MKKRRADGRQQIALDIGISADGKRLRKYFYGKTITEARDKRDAYVRQMESGLCISTDITVCEWSLMWLESTRELTTVTTYSGKVSAIREQNKVLGDYKIKDLRPIHIQEYMTSLAGASKSTISKRRSIIKAILDSAVANNLIQRSPYVGVTSPKGYTVGHRALTDEERNAVEQSDSRLRARDWAMVMMYTGLRKEELCGLMADDYDGNTFTVRRAIAMKENVIKETKTAAGVRTVPVPDKIKCCIPQRKSGFIYQDNNGRHLNDNSFKRGWSTFLGHIDFKFTPHDCRTTYATLLYSAGVDVKTAQYLLGHSSIEMTLEIYTKLSKDKKQKGIDDYLKYIN